MLWNWTWKITRYSITPSFCTILWVRIWYDYDVISVADPESDPPRSETFTYHDPDPDPGRIRIRIGTDVIGRIRIRYNLTGFRSRSEIIFGDQAFWKKNSEMKTPFSTHKLDLMTKWRIRSRIKMKSRIRIYNDPLGRIRIRIRK